MKNRYILLAIVGIVACLSACKKDNQQTGINNSAIVGKWDEVKYYLSQTSNNGVVTDTTINASAFNSNDYAQFNNNNTVNIFKSGGNPPAGGAAPDFIQNSTYNYTISGSVATLSFTGPYSEPVILTGDTLILNQTVTMTDANNIVMHITYYNGPIKTNPKIPSYVSDTYYTRAQ